MYRIPEHPLESSYRPGDKEIRMSDLSALPSIPTDRFEQIQRLFSRAKILAVELASLIGLVVILYEGIKHELKW